MLKDAVVFNSARGPAAHLVCLGPIPVGCSRSRNGSSTCGGVEDEVLANRQLRIKDVHLMDKACRGGGIERKE